MRQGSQHVRCLQTAFSHHTANFLAGPVVGAGFRMVYRVDGDALLIAQLRYHY